MRAAHASADLWRPDGSPPISNEQWRTMKLQEEWVRRATQARLPSDEAAERLHHILSFLSTLTRTDARLYIGWVIKSRKSAAVAYANTQAKRASKKKDKSYSAVGRNTDDSQTNIPGAPWSRPHGHDRSLALCVNDPACWTSTPVLQSTHDRTRTLVSWAQRHMATQLGSEHRAEPLACYKYTWVRTPHVYF